MSLALTIQRLFAPTVLTGSAATIYTCPPSPATNALINARVRCTNTDTASQAVTLYAVPLAGTAGAGNCFANGESIAPNAHADFDVPVLAAGDFLQAFAGNASKVTIFSLAGTVISQ